MTICAECKRFCIILALIGTLCASGSCQEIVFKETKIELGKIDVMRNEKFFAVFEFSNEDKYPLVINGIRKSCGCSIEGVYKTKSDLEGAKLNASNEPLIPKYPVIFHEKEKGYLLVTYKPSKVWTKDVLLFSVVSNAKNAKDLILSVNMETYSGFTVCPAELKYVLDYKSEMTRMISIASNVNAPFQIEKIKIKNNLIKILNPENMRFTLTTHSLELRLINPESISETKNEKISILIKDYDSTISIPLHIIYDPPVRIYPQAFVIDIKDTKGTVDKYFNVDSKYPLGHDTKITGSSNFCNVMASMTSSGKMNLHLNDIKNNVRFGKISLLFEIKGAKYKINVSVLIS